MQQVAPSSDLFTMIFNNKLAQFVSPYQIPWCRELMHSACPGRIWTPHTSPTSSHLGQSGGKGAGLPMQENHSDCSRVDQHALVLGSISHVKPDPPPPLYLANLNLHVWLLEPLLLRGSQSDQYLQSGATAIRWTSGYHL